MSEREDVFTEMTNANHEERTAMHPSMGVQAKSAKDPTKFWHVVARVTSVAIGVTACTTAQKLNAGDAFGVLCYATATFGLAYLTGWFDRWSRR